MTNRRDLWNLSPTDILEISTKVRSFGRAQIWVVENKGGRHLLYRINHGGLSFIVCDDSALNAAINREGAAKLFFAASKFMSIYSAIFRMVPLRSFFNKNPYRFILFSGKYKISCALIDDSLLFIWAWCQNNILLRSTDYNVCR